MPLPDGTAAAAEARLETRLRRAAVALVLLTAAGLGLRALWPAAPAVPGPIPRPAPPPARAALPELPPGITAVMASHASEPDPAQMAFDGQISYGPAGPRNRWASWGSGHGEDWLAWRFAAPLQLDQLGVHFFTDTRDTQVPAAVRLETFRDGAWHALAGVTAEPPQPAAGRENVLRFPALRATELRLVLVHQPGRSSAVTEITLPGESERR